MKTITILAFLVLGACTLAVSQPLAVDARAGFSMLSGGGSSTALALAAGVEIPIQQNLAFRPGIDITFHDGTPIEITGLLKYMLPSTTASIPLYIDGGLSAWFIPGASSLGLDFGGGTYFSASEGKYQIPAEIRMGPIFNSGASSFQVSISAGIRFSLGS
jgi:hypothetical protein